MNKKREQGNYLKKKFIALNTTIMLGLGSVFSIPAVHAETSIQSQRTEVQSQIAEANNILADLKAELTNLTAQVDRLKASINENNTKIENIQNQIVKTQADIEALKKEIVVLEERIAQRQEVLKERAIAFQQSGGNVDYIGVLLGATSFSDFLSRVGAVATIVSADQDILAAQEQDKADLENKKATVKAELDQLERSKAELVDAQADFTEAKKEIDTKIITLEEKKKQTAALQTSLEKKDANLAAQIAAYQAAQAKAAERKVAQEKAIKEVAAQVEKSTSASDTSNSSSSSSTSEAPNPSTSTSVAVSAPSSANVSAAISAGYKYIGHSTYVWGGGRTASDVANGYFDCSGFVAWAYSQAGVSLPASTSGLRYAGTQISTSQMQPGDLVFFNTYKTDGHVGIYLGNGKFIGSQSSTGVAIADMTSGYWGSKFNGRVVRVN